MTKETLCYVKKPGMLTTIQDMGRFGYQSQGIPPAGVMDYYAYTIANMLTGNHLREAVLEITMTGPVLTFASKAVLAITGGDLQPELNGEKAPMWKTFTVEDGDKLSFKGPKQGARAYLAVSGGINGEETLNSKSTYVKAKLGGMEGRALQKGDALTYTVPSEILPTGKGVHSDLIPSYPSTQELRVIEGPESNTFTNEAIQSFYKLAYTVTNESDRMGLRLNGPDVSHVEKADILSDAVSFGTIQVASDGQPMILMADRQTTGGYTRIATVITVDLPKAAQLLPGQKITFKKVSIEQAHELILKERKQFASLAFALDHMQS
ncbi:biotin-dependent carboxyltransferase family protein [Alteribacillus sp. JSM 102045]|uniref:5-oxoprolinase subunit C family protein n=1 Tax=Alteribacillus sp. JSM 102045 TaxID=1562101 RepID=UPI0035C154ED